MNKKNKGKVDWDAALPIILVPLVMIGMYVVGHISAQRYYEDILNKAKQCSLCQADYKPFINKNNEIEIDKPCNICQGTGIVTYLYDTSDGFKIENNKIVKEKDDND